jgi:hypothetical protein
VAEDFEVALAQFRTVICWSAEARRAARPTGLVTKTGRRAVLTDRTTRSQQPHRQLRASYRVDAPREVAMLAEQNVIGFDSDAITRDADLLTDCIV